MGGSPDQICQAGEPYSQPMLMMGCSDCFCGNASIDVVDPVMMIAEPCDDGGYNQPLGWYLDPKCRLQRCEPLDYCGDGALNGPEKCDPNDLSSGQYCLANCQLGPYPGDNVCTAIEIGRAHV